MKKLIILLILVTQVNVLARHIFTIKNLNNPESALITSKHIYISEMGKQVLKPLIKDGNISRYFLNGQKDYSFKNKNPLIDPMGMTFHNNILYTADSYRVIGISTITGHTVFNYSFKKQGATFLNDIAIFRKRYLLVTATNLRKVFIIDIKKKTSRVLNAYLDDLQVNGIAVNNKTNRLYLAANTKHTLGKPGNGKVLSFQFHKNIRSVKKIKAIAIGKFLDGIVLHKNKVAVTDWGGRGNDGAIYVLNKQNLQLIGRSYTKTSGLADIDYSGEKQLLVAPDLTGGLVRGYRTSL